MVHDLCMHPWLYRVEPFLIAGNLYYVGNSDVSSYLIDTGDGLLVIDTAFPQTCYQIVDSIWRLGFDPKDVRLILHSHGHYDHFGGTRALAELTGAETCLGKDDIAILEQKPELSWAPEYGVPFYEVFSVDRPLFDGDAVELGATSIRCVHTPGHTDGAMSFFFQVEEEGRSCRVGMHGGPGLNTLSDEYLAKNGLSKTRRETYMKSLDRLQGEEVDIFVGIHPNQSGLLEKKALVGQGGNPFVDPGAWNTFLDTLRRNAEKSFGVETRPAGLD